MGEVINIINETCRRCTVRPCVSGDGATRSICPCPSSDGVTWCNATVVTGDLAGVPTIRRVEKWVELGELKTTGEAIYIIGKTYRQCTICIRLIGDSVAQYKAMTVTRGLMGVPPVHFIGGGHSGGGSLLAVVTSGKEQWGVVGRRCENTDDLAGPILAEK